jgi:hypothetical protein
MDRPSGAIFARIEAEIHRPLLHRVRALEHGSYQGVLLEFLFFFNIRKQPPDRFAEDVLCAYPQAHLLGLRVGNAVWEQAQSVVE